MSKSRKFPTPQTSKKERLELFIEFYVDSVLRLGLGNDQAKKLYSRDFSENITDDSLLDVDVLNALNGANNALERLRDLQQKYKDE